MGELGLLGETAKNFTARSGAVECDTGKVGAATVGRHRFVRGAIPFVRGTAMAGALLLLAGGLSGCGFGGVEFKGKIFDVIGMNDPAKKKASLAPRTGLVTPPSLDRLPEPGSQRSGGGELASINDPDRVSVVDKKELAARQAAYCKKHYDPAVFRGDGMAESIEGPSGRCSRSAVDAYKEWVASPEQPPQN